MIFRLVSVLAITLGLGLALPNNFDTIVPESNLASVTDLLQTGSSFELARTKVHQLLQKGTTTDDCKTLAQNTIDEISSAVTSDQQGLDELDKGHSCATEGQAEVTVKQGELESANTNAANAETALQTATVAPVTLAAQPGNTLGGSQCSWIEADPAYQAYVEKLNLATEDHTTTKALATAAQTALDDAIADAARLKHECLCRVQTEHAAAWALIDNNDETRAASWTQAHNMICVVDHTTHANCAQPAVPTNTQPEVNDEVATEHCTAKEPAAEEPIDQEPADVEPADVEPEAGGSEALPCTAPLCRTDADIRQAVKEWTANPKNAETKYGHISQWQTQRVTNMALLVQQTPFNEDISGWDVSGVTDMHGMFFGASSFNQDLSDWDVSAVTDMHAMFRFASNFDQDLSGWDVSAVTDMRYMFYGASNFNQDLSDWDVSAVTVMESMFQDASSFNQDLSGWNVHAVTDMTNMFQDANSMPNLPNWCDSRRCTYLS